MKGQLAEEPTNDQPTEGQLTETDQLRDQSSSDQATKGPTEGPTNQGTDRWTDQPKAE